jgi:hypothetical protein
LRGVCRHPEYGRVARDSGRRDSLKTGRFRGFQKLEAFQNGDFLGFLL